MTSQACAHALRTRLVELQRDTEKPFIDEIREPGRTIPRSYRSHVRGWHPVRDGHPAIAFESLQEARFITALVALPGVLTIASQPITLRYRMADTTRLYTPDFFVELEKVPPVLKELGFQLRTFVEVKPLKLSLKAERLIARRFSAAREATGFECTLVTEVDLKGVLSEVAHAR